MFLSNPAPTRSILANNENAPAARRTKSIGEHGGAAKKATFDENAAKTPHRTKEAKGLGGGPTTQRRRRALGDISNRKGGGGAGGAGKTGLVLKQRSSNVPSSSSQSRTSLVKFAKTPSTKSTGVNKARLGGASGVKSGSKPKQLPIDQEMIASRFSSVSVDDEVRSPFDLVPEDELFMAERMSDEFRELERKEQEERDRVEEQKEEEWVQESIRAVQEADRRDMIAMCQKAADGEANDEEDGWDVLQQKLPWEEEDGAFDPAEERRLSGTDPHSLWGDILSG